jgi:ABC-type transporter Mla subunit MlaD
MESHIDKEMLKMQQMQQQSQISNFFAALADNFLWQTIMDDFDQQRKFVSNEISQILSNFNIAIQTLSLQKDEVQKTSLELTQDSVMLKRATRSIVASVEQLFQMTASLKQSKLNDDDEFIKRVARLKKQKQNLLAKHRKVFKEMLSELEEIEDEMIRNM